MHSFFSDADVDVAAAAFLYALTSFLLLSRSLTHMTPIRRVKKWGFKGPCNTLFSQNKYVTINQLEMCMLANKMIGMQNTLYLQQLLSFVSAFYLSFCIRTKSYERYLVLI